MIDEAARVIAVTLLHKAYEHLPPRRVAGAVNLADIEPIARAITALTLEAYSAGKAAGEKKGRRELAEEMEADWAPVADAIRAQANSPSFAGLERRRNDALIEASPYTGGPVPVW